MRRRRRRASRSCAYALFALRGDATVAWETLGEEALATYVFRGGTPSAAAEIDEGLRAIGFAREPLYLAEAELKTAAAHRHHMPLLRRSAALGLLRRRLLGRVIHAEPDQYAARLDELAGGGDVHEGFAVSQRPPRWPLNSAPDVATSQFALAAAVQQVTLQELLRETTRRAVAEE